MAELLDIVNENDEVIGQIDRDDPDKLRHIFRVVFISFYTPQRKVILQRRSMLKKSGPGLLTSTVSGHVSSGQTYDEAAIRETYEETGTTIDTAKLQNLGTVFGGDAMRTIYAYPFDGPTSTLQVEENEGDGFIEVSISELREDRIVHPEKYTPFILGEAATKLYDYIESVK